MGLVSITLPSDGTSADVADYNTPLTTITTALNGNIDNNNISGVSGSKVTVGTLAGTAFDTNTQGGWLRGILPAVSSVAANGNGSYNVTFASTVASYLTPGMRIRSTRTVAAPTQCTSLNGTNQYYSKTSPAGMTWTDDFNAGAWVKLTSYAAGAIISRYNGTSGWSLEVNSSGQVLFIGYNAGAANFSQVLSYQSLPLNKWVHVAAQLDMSAFTATTTTSFVMINGVDVPCIVSRGGTNPTALVQAGDLNIGAKNAATFFAGKIAQSFVSSAKITQATLLTYISQTLAGSETSIASAYTFNNTINDLNTTNTNNLTANGSALATNADSPFSIDATGTPGATLDFGIVQKVATTVATIQVPEGCTIPTTGGVSSIDFASSGVPYGFPKQADKWLIETLKTTIESGIATGTSGLYVSSNHSVTVPIGQWVPFHEGAYNQHNTSSGSFNSSFALALGGVVDLLSPVFLFNSASASDNHQSFCRFGTPFTVSVATSLTLQAKSSSGAGTTTAELRGDLSACVIRLLNGYL